MSGTAWGARQIAILGKSFYAAFVPPKTILRMLAMVLPKRA